MFTGIVEEIGTVAALEQRDGGWHLTVRASETLGGTILGHSIAVNGVCLTVTTLAGDRFTFGLAPETLARTNLGDLKPGDGVNLERSLKADGRLGGHFVQGHIDGTGVLHSKTVAGDSLVCVVKTPAPLLRYLVPKGFVTVDGASLTVIEVREDHFTFMLVAYTQGHIVLPTKPVGARVNLEVDLLAKYAEKFMTARG